MSAMGLFQTSYPSNPVPIPDDFLTSPAPSTPVFSHVPFADNGLTAYRNCTAFTLTNVLSPEECKQLLSLAEDSVPRKEGDSAWRPAMVSLGVGIETPAPGYRNSDRIIWDQQVVADRIWERCAAVPPVKDLLQKVSNRDDVGEGEWVLSRLNDRLRFLKYTEGQFFKRHCDGPYGYDTDGKHFQTHYTLHLYLNDSSAESETGEGCEGGATAFHSYDNRNRLDVNPKAGTVLIFQHRLLLHEGAVVTKGVKYTVRSDVLYEWVPAKKYRSHASAS